jgi:hypothetical protein
MKPNRNKQIMNDEIYIYINLKITIEMNNAL